MSKEKRYYIAYGSNLNVEQMMRRCPGAKPIGTAMLEHNILYFRGSGSGYYLTIEPKIGSKVPVAVWEITPEDELALDSYEGYGYNWASTSSFKRKTRSLNDSNVYAFYRPKWMESTSTGTTTGKKSVDELAKEVIAGKWSAGDERKTKLTAAGYSYSAVQSRVNEMLSGKVQNKKSVDELAHEVICGKWGNGEDRKNRLTVAGYNYSVVQSRVNKLMK